MSDRGGFQYWREPLCVAAVILYVANSIWWKPMSSDPGSFVNCYFGDVLCLPVCIPITLWLQRRLSLRGHDRHPSLREIGGHWLLWTMCFEGLGPQLPQLAPGAVSDPWDAVAYALGGVVAAIAWRPDCAQNPGATPSLAEVAGRATVAALVAAFVLSAYRFGVVFR